MLVTSLNNIRRRKNRRLPDPHVDVFLFPAASAPIPVEGNLAFAVENSHSLDVYDLYGGEYIVFWYHSRYETSHVTSVGGKKSFVLCGTSERARYAMQGSERDQRRGRVRGVRAVQPMIESANTIGTNLSAENNCKCLQRAIK